MESHPITTMPQILTTPSDCFATSFVYMLIEKNTPFFYGWHQLAYILLFTTKFSVLNLLSLHDVHNSLNIYHIAYIFGCLLLEMLAWTSVVYFDQLKLIALSFLFFFTFVPFLTENLFQCRNKWFRPANGMRSTHLLVKIHNRHLFRVFLNIFPIVMSLHCPDVDHSIKMKLKPEEFLYIMFPK